MACVCVIVFPQLSLNVQVCVRLPPHSSKVPVITPVSVPLISLLLMGQFFIGFFLNSDDPLSNITRATTAITMFSAAYIAEIVRGSIQAVLDTVEGLNRADRSGQRRVRIHAAPARLRDSSGAMSGRRASSLWRRPFAR